MENASPQLMQALRTYIDHHHIDIHRMLSENGGKRSSCGSGSMLKCAHAASLRILILASEAKLSPKTKLSPNTRASIPRSSLCCR